MSTPKYDPPIDEPGIALDEHLHGHMLGLRYADGEIRNDFYFNKRERAVQERDVIAIAIADRVHGAELARLRAERQSCFDHLCDLRAVIKDGLPVSGWQYEHEAVAIAAAELARLRADLEGVPTLSGLPIDQQGLLRAARRDMLVLLLLSDERAFVSDHAETFNALSTLLGLPISNDDGVPWELRASRHVEGSATMPALKYDPPAGEPRIALAGMEPRLRLDIVLGNSALGATVDHEVTFSTTESARAAQQRIALAIADRVYGPELAGHAQAIAANQDYWIDIVKRLREAMIDLLRANDSDTLLGHGVADAFDDASRAVGLPTSNDDAVPFELLPSEPVAPFKPTLERVRQVDTRGYRVSFGTGHDDYQFFDDEDFSEAAAAFGERYATWKERYAAWKVGQS